MEKRVIKIKNGDFFMDYTIFKCSRCGKEVEEAWPHIETENEVFCWDCAFIKGLISEYEYLENVGLCLPNIRACVRNDEIFITTRKFPWEKTPKQNRHSAEYSKWRTAVFERDGFKCQECGQVGGTLNAHHIKEFAKYPELRFDVDNGITLCEKCHKDLHRRKRKNE